MHRIDGPSATSDKKFTEGSPVGGVPATVVSASWLNDVQENVCKAIEAAGITLEKGNYNQLTQAIAALSGQAGEIRMFARSTAPTGFLKANGAAVSRTTYAALFAAIGTAAGSGDGTTTFNLPDYRGEFPRGWDDGRGVDPGRALLSAQADSLKAHEHPARQSLGLNGTSGNNGLVAFNNTTVGSALPSGAVGVVGDTETRGRNIATLFCIKY